MMLEHLLHEVRIAIAGCFRTDQAAAKFQGFPGQDSREFLSQAFVLPEHVTDFTDPDPNVASRNVGVRADVVEEFGHEGLAESHHFAIRFAPRIEVGPTFAGPHGKGRQAVLEGLFEAQELENAEVDRGVESESTFVGANGIVELDPVAPVDTYISFIVLPLHTEDDGAIGFGHALEDSGLSVSWIGEDERDDGLGHFIHGLMEFHFAWGPLLEPRHETFER